MAIVAVAQLPAELRTRFDYDDSLPLDPETQDVDQLPNRRMLDLTWRSPSGGRARAFLVEPGGDDALLPAVVYVHPGQGNRTTFLDEAHQLAGLGIASLLVDAPFNRPEQMRAELDPADPTADLVQLVVDVRRGIDLLLTRSDIDPERLAYVGHSLGATVGGVLVGVETRLRAAVLMAGFSAQSIWYEESPHPVAADARRRLGPERLEAQVRLLRPMDAVNYLPYASAALLFQFADDDEFISAADSEQSLEAAPAGREVRRYSADHFFNQEARDDRLRWLATQLSRPATSLSVEVAARARDSHRGLLILNSSTRRTRGSFTSMACTRSSIRRNIRSLASGSCPKTKKTRAHHAGTR